MLVWFDPKPLSRHMKGENLSPATGEHTIDANGPESDAEGAVIRVPGTVNCLAIKKSQQWSSFLETIAATGRYSDSHLASIDGEEKSL